MPNPFGIPFLGAGSSLWPWDTGRMWILGSHQPILGTGRIQQLPGPSSGQFQFSHSRSGGTKSITEFGADVQVKAHFPKEPHGFSMAKPRQSPLPSLHTDSCWRRLLPGKQMVQGCCLLRYFFLLLSCFYFSLGKRDWEQSLVIPTSFCQRV